MYKKKFRFDGYIFIHNLEIIIKTTSFTKLTNGILKDENK